MKITLPNGITIDELTADEAVTLIGRINSANDTLSRAIEGVRTLELIAHDESHEEAQIETVDLTSEEPETDPDDEPYTANAEHRLTWTQRRTLERIRTSPDGILSVSALGRAANCSNAAASERLRTLVKLGLAEHVPHRTGLYRAFTPRELRERDGVLSPTE